MAIAASATLVAGPRRFRRVMLGARRDAILSLALSFLFVVVIAATFAPIVAPRAATAVSLSDRLAPPTWLGGDFPLGADGLGRDVLSRLIYGARISLVVGAGVVVLSGVVGTTLGLLAGYLGGRWDLVIMRLSDMQLAFPSLILVIAVISVLSPSVPVLIGVLSAVGWMIFARVARGTALQLRKTSFVEAAEFAGCSRWWIVRRHFLPALVPPLMTQALLEFAHVVLAEASLSYLGLGIQPPDTSWGLMVAESRQYMEQGWWTVLFPGLAIAFTVLSLNLIGSWLRVRLDPQQVHRLDVDPASVT